MIVLAREITPDTLDLLKGKSWQIVLDQIRTVDKTRLVKRVGKIDELTRAQALTLLAELFAP